MGAPQFLSQTHILYRMDLQQYGTSTIWNLKFAESVWNRLRKNPRTQLHWSQITYTVIITNMNSKIFTIILFALIILAMAKTKVNQNDKRQKTRNRAKTTRERNKAAKLAITRRLNRLQCNRSRMEKYRQQLCKEACKQRQVTLQDIYDIVKYHPESHRGHACSSSVFRHCQILSGGKV